MIFEQKKIKKNTSSDKKTSKRLSDKKFDLLVKYSKNL